MRGYVMQSLQPKVEKMEAAWARLHTITGAETPEEVIAYFEGMPCQHTFGLSCILCYCLATLYCLMLRECLRDHA